MSAPAQKPASEPRRAAALDAKGKGKQKAKGVGVEPGAQVDIRRATEDFAKSGSDARRARQARAVASAKAAPKAITMRKALEDMALLGSVIAGPSWAAWRVLLIAIAGEALTPEERLVFRALTGREKEPGEPVEEFWGAIGRRGGKSRAMAVLAVFLACFRDYSHVTVAGEKPTVLLIAQNVRQASILLGYILGIIESTRLLAGMIRNKTADSIELTNGVTIETRPASFRGLRGLTLVAAIADEIAFFYTEDSQSANPDTEILNAVRPSLATTRGPLICISSPYARRGELWLTYERHFGPAGDPKILVAKAPSRTMNSSLPESVVTRALERDPAAAAAEYMAAFRSDLERFISIEAVHACVMLGVVEIPPAKRTYVAGIDPSGGAHDAMTMSLGFRDFEGGAILCAVRERKPPFSPAAVVAEFVETLRAYGVNEVIGDAYGAQWVQESFQRLGVRYRVSEKTRSQLYSELLPMINSRQVSLLDHPKLISQLVGLERRTGRSGKDIIDHPPGGFDDIVNSAAIALVNASARRGPILHWG